jgi:hypothetical protein
MPQSTGFERIVIPAAVIAVLSLASFAVWKLNTAAPDPAVRRATATRPTPQPTQAPAESAASARVSPEAPPAMQPQGTQQTLPQGSDDQGVGDLPVQVHFRRSPRTKTLEAAVVNTSTEALLVEILVFNPKTQQSAMTQLSLPPMSGSKFGGEDGLELEANDRITLRGASYRDQVTTIPAL